MRRMLLVGGLADGIRVDVPDELNSWVLECPAPLGAPIPSIREGYRRTIMWHQGGKKRELIEFFRHDALSEYDALRLMVLNYQRPEGL